MGGGVGAGAASNAGLDDPLGVEDPGPARGAGEHGVGEEEPAGLREEDFPHASQPG
jgi:hypothetical protein